MVAADLDDIPRRFRIPVIVILLGYILFHNVRILFVILTDFSENFFMQPSVLTTITFIMTLTFTFLWGGSLFILDAARILAEKDKKAKELEQQAIHDKLTGVFNRQSLDSTLKAEMDRQDRYRNALSLIMLDVDLFKSINDNFGHDEGDRVLVEIANRIYSSIRECDLLFRWGGEEFLILVPNTDKAGAAIIAEKLRTEISGRQISAVGTVTASFGVAERSPEESRDDWFSHVDKSMYAAKQNGSQPRQDMGTERASSVVGYPRRLGQGLGVRRALDRHRAPSHRSSGKRAYKSFDLGIPQRGNPGKKSTSCSRSSACTFATRKPYWNASGTRSWRITGTFTKSAFAKAKACTAIISTTSGIRRRFLTCSSIK